MSTGEFDSRIYAKQFKYDINSNPAIGKITFT